MPATPKPRVSIVMGSRSDLPVLKVATTILDELDIPFEVRVLSAHRTPDEAGEYARTLFKRGVEVCIAAAGAAAHLPGVIAAKTHIPVIGVPVVANELGGLDALLAIVQMPGGVPVATMGTGKAGAKNSALTAARILGVADAKVRRRLQAWIRRQTQRTLLAGDVISREELEAI
jgi:5-(carboxyamino)imidazole ribonucleotide mutase